MRKKKAKVSPIKGNLSRLPGQSLDEEIRRIERDEISMYAFFIGITAAFAIADWLFYLFDFPRNPILTTVLAVVAFVYFYWQLRKKRPHLDNLIQGREGEIAVGQHLVRHGLFVIHDVLGDAFNLDHVVVDEHGVFVIETKTYSKPEKGQAEVLYDGNTISVNGFDTGDKILIQVKSAAKWLEEVIESSTGKRIPVQPVVVFPGWWIEGTSTGKFVWVMNEKYLVKAIRGGEPRLSPEDKHLIAFHLTQFARLPRPAS